MRVLIAEQDHANYARLLGEAAPDLQVVTSEDPDDVRKQRIADMGGDRTRVLVATDCLSEGINLQDRFTAVLHYDLPWNPTRLEQREGRVDRFGQQARVVKTCLLYGADNPIDGIVLEVLLTKVREIRKSTGINVPFPEDSQSIIDTITHGGPAGSTNTLVYKVYQDGFRQLDLGSSAAQSVVLMAIAVVFTIMQFRSLERKVNYQV